MRHSNHDTQTQKDTHILYSTIDSSEHSEGQ